MCIQQTTASFTAIGILAFEFKIQDVWYTVDDGEVNESLGNDVFLDFF